MLTPLPDDWVKSFCWKPQYPGIVCVGDRLPDDWVKSFCWKQVWTSARCPGEPDYFLPDDWVKSFCWKLSCDKSQVAGSEPASRRLSKVENEPR